MNDSQKDRDHWTGDNEPLSDELRQAIERTQRWQAPPELVARLKQRLTEHSQEHSSAAAASRAAVTPATPSSSTFARPLVRFSLASIALAAVAFVAVALVSAALVSRAIVAWRARTVPNRPSPLPAAASDEPSNPPAWMVPQYSAVTRFTLSQVAWRQIEADVGEVEQELEQVSESLRWSALRREISRTLDEYSNWSDEP